MGIGSYLMLPKTLVYENSDYDFSLQYPASWKLETKEDFMGTIATFIPDRDIPTQVKINVENLSRSINLDEYTTLIENDSYKLLFYK
jgi:hypothetical protein